MPDILHRVSSLFKIVPSFVATLYSRQTPAHRDVSIVSASSLEMDEHGSNPMPPADNDAGTAYRALPSGSGRHYRDHDFVPTRPGPLDYDDMDIDPPTSHHKRYNSQDGYHLVVHGADHSSKYSENNTASISGSHETLEQARGGKSHELPPLPSKRKRGADAETSLQHSSKKPYEAKDDRSDRLCLQCGNYHSSPCYVPYCSSCDLNHYLGIPCLEAMEQLKKRLELRAPLETPVSSRQKGNKKMARSAMPLRSRIENQFPLALSNQHAPITLLGSDSQSSVNKQQKESPGKRICPICPECGNPHRSACKWLFCDKCQIKHNPETQCAVAEARLKARLEEEDAKQAQVTEKIRKGDQSMINKDNNMVTDFQSRRSSAPSPGRAFGPGNLQNRLDIFDRGWGTSQQKILKTRISPPTVQPSSQQLEVTNSNRVNPAASVDLAAPANMTFNFGADGRMSWSLDSNKTIHFGLPPSNPHFSVSVSSMPEQHNNHIHPSRQAFFSEPAQTAAPVPQPLADISSTGSVLPLYSPRSDTSQVATYGTSVEHSVDAFIADVAQGMHSNVRDALGCVDGPRRYLAHIRRNGSS
ncbi:unnamed protein product [Aureobasidium uvarum]|uniref:Uncharacterized protein n=1 Tax=Aureobasidium uvarum TaxID=2773716 RepID=A0A9N8KBG4_9PEZI|nr:unnamed protein product [Aureobasidium uvarum]